MREENRMSWYHGKDASVHLLVLLMKTAIV